MTTTQWTTKTSLLCEQKEGKGHGLRNHPESLYLYMIEHALICLNTSQLSNNTIYKVEQNIH